MTRDTKTKARSTSTDDIRLAPAYDFTHAARYLRLPKSTVRNWFVGANAGKPALQLADKKTGFVSFVGLAEAYVLSSLRRQYDIPLQRIRSAVAYLKSSFDSEHPLVQHDFKTDGVDLFIEHLGDIINASKYGQTAMADIVSLYLSRIEYGRDGIAERLYPFTRTDQRDEPKLILIDPRVGFGRPMIGNSGIATFSVAERFKAGESVEELAEDFERDVEEIEAAIRSEFDVPRAA